MIKTTWAALAVALALPLLHGCGDENATQGQVRNVNATTEYATMDLYDVDSKSDSNLLISATPTYAVSDYAGLEGGTYTFNIVGAGGSSAAASTSGTVSKQDHFALITYLTGGSLQTSFVSEEETAPTSGNAKLRIFNAAASEAGGVDVFVTSHDCGALVDTDTALGTDVEGLQTSFSQILAASSGTTWNICVTGTGNKADLRLAAIGAKFTDGQITTLILTHTSGGVLLNGMLLDQQGALTQYTNSLARLRVVSDAAAAAPVSASIGSLPVALNSPSPTVGAYVTVPAGAVTTTITVSGVTLADPNLTLATGADYTLFVGGTAGAATVVLLPDSNTPSTSTALPVKMRLVNGVNGLPDAASLTSDGTIVADGIAFGSASTYANISASDNAADLEASAGSSSLWSSTDNTLTSGAVYTVFLLGDYNPLVVPPVTPILRQDRAATGVTLPASSATTSDAAS